MAKKTKKSAKKSKTTKKPARKATTARSAKKKPARKPAAKRNPFAPIEIKTGRGPGPGEIGRSLVEMFNRGEFAEIEDRWWSPKITSIEGMGFGWTGRKAVEAKNSEWMKTHIIHGTSAEGPYIGATGFAVKFRMDVEDTTTGSRENFEEVGVYTVRDGKIVQEEFMYGSSTPVSQPSGGLIPE